MKRFLHRGLFLAAATATLVLAGCKSSGAAKQSPPDPSGLPEVIVPARTADKIKAVAAAFFRDRGYTETAARHGLEMVFDKPTKSGRGGARALRVRLRLYKQRENSWRLVGTPMGVNDWRSELESETLLRQGASQIQAFLDEIKKRVESGP